MSRSRFFGLVVAAMLTLPLCPVTTASATDPLEDDLRDVAIAESLDVEAVREYAQGQEQFAEISNDIADKWPQDFVTAEWAGPNSASTRVVVKPGASDAIRAAYPDLRVVESAALSAVEREQIEWNVVTALGEAEPSRSAGVTIDPMSNDAVISLNDDDLTYMDTNSRDNESSLETAMTLLHKAGVSDVRVEYLGAEQTAAEFGSGGNWGSACTAGFTAKRGSAPAITTTAHCGSRSSYDGARLAGRKATSHAGGDVMSFTASGGRMTNSVRYDWGKSRAIRRVGDPVVGNVVCHFGITTGHSCAEVKKVRQSVYFSRLGYSVGQLVIVDKNVSKNGDSGGPWFWSDKAHGIHMGTCGGKSCFTRIGALSSIGTAIYLGR